MKYQDKRDGEIKETNFLVMHNGVSSFRVEQMGENEIQITKIDIDNGHAISIYPIVSNQIVIK